MQPRNRKYLAEEDLAPLVETNVYLSSLGINYNKIRGQFTSYFLLGKLSQLISWCRYMGFHTNCDQEKTQKLHRTDCSFQRSEYLRGNLLLWIFTYFFNPNSRAPHILELHILLFLLVANISCRTQILLACAS